MIVRQVRAESDMSIRRLSLACETPVSTVGRWVGPAPVKDAGGKVRRCPVSDDDEVRSKVRALCEEPRHLLFGHRRIRALLLRRWHMRLNRKTVLRVMQKEGLTRPKVWHRVKRPKRLEKMNPVRPNEAWQIDMTSFQLSDMRMLYLITLIDCYTRQVVGWTLDWRCRASEWISAVRMGLESRGLRTKEDCRGMTLRSDNGSQPCSKKFVEYLGSVGVSGQYTGYNAPDDNAYVERFIRTIKEEEIWLNQYDTFAEAHRAVDEYIAYYNQERIHSALKYITPNEMAAAHVALAVA